MQDDKTTSSETTTKHRNHHQQQSRRSNHALLNASSSLDATPSLLTVPSSDSTQSTSAVSQRRLMRLSEKMSLVKQRRGAPLSPTTATASSQASPTYSVTRNRGAAAAAATTVTHRTSQTLEQLATEEEEEEEEDKYSDDDEDVFSDFSTPATDYENQGIGMISPVADTPNNNNKNTNNQELYENEEDNEEGMDRIESQRAHRDAAIDNNSSSEDDDKNDSTKNNSNNHHTTTFLEQPSLMTKPKRTRIPGGAAAKLMLLGPQPSVDDEAPTPRPSPDSSTGSEKQNQLQAALDRARNQVKSQFNMRVISESPRESNSKEKDDAGAVVDLQEYRCKLVKESSNLFDRKEVFYETAEAAIQALQTAKHFMQAFDTQSVYSKGSIGGAMSHDAMSVSTSVTSAFQIGDDNETSNFESLARKDVGEELLSWKAQQVVESLPDEMQDPNPTLAKLLQTIASPVEGDVPDLGTTVRRKNACGALQVLTAQPTNRIPLAWTIGVLPALTSVLADTGSEGAHVTYPNKRHRHEFEVARDRAILALVNLATPKENRIPLFHTPNLVHWLVALILEGRGQPRKGACAILAYLAKTPDNRLLMVQVPRLIEALATKVLKKRPPRMEYPEPRHQRSDSSPEHEDDDDLDEDDLDDEDLSESDLEEEEEESDESEGTDGEQTQTTRGTATDRDETVRSERRRRRRRRSRRQRQRRSVVRSESALSEPSKFLSVSSSYSNQSCVTQRLAGARSPVELCGYDETADGLLREARNYAFAAMSNLIKEKDNAFHFARDASLVKVMSEIALCHDSPNHVHAVKFLACLTRHRLNSKVLVFRRRSVVPALVEATGSPSEMARLYACYGLQNLSQDKSCRQELAISENLLICLCERARGATEQEAERLAALSALKNLTDEPANLIPMSNTTDCIATLMHLAHGRQEGVTPLMQYRACDALATLSHWLRKIATSGQALTEAKTGKSGGNFFGAGGANKELFVPSLRVVTVNQWQ